MRGGHLDKLEVVVAIEVNSSIDVPLTAKFCIQAVVISMSRRKNLDVTCLFVV